MVNNVKTDEQKQIEKIEGAFQEFLKEMDKLEKERNVLLDKYSTEIEKAKLENVRKKIKQVL